MQIFTDPLEFRSHNEKARSSGKRIGLFATLGSVHQGHLSLVDSARSENDVVVSSVFVNPLMFNNVADANEYPSAPQLDLERLEERGVDSVIVPDRESIYPPGHNTRVTVPALEGRYESRSLPNSISGISTICSILYQICVPHRWYFGEKDAQQVALVKHLARDLFWSCEIVPCPSIREQDGLPFSSRNATMTNQEREAAVAVVRAIQAAKDVYDAGHRRASDIIDASEKAVAAIDGATFEYAAVVDRDSFADCDTADSNSLIVAAADLGRMRVLDNHPLGRPLPVEIA